MKPKVYRAKLDISDVRNFLIENNYRQIGRTKKIKEYQIKIELFFDVHLKQIPDWVEELLVYFNSTNIFGEETPNQYNAILIVETKSSVYLIPRGQGFRAAEKVSDLDFGLDFAEKTLRSKDIVMKSVSYVQRNKMRGITNYKKEKNELPQASESYFYVSGKPADEHIFGSNIDCGTAISFTSNYNLNDESSANKFYQLFNEIDITFKLAEKKTTIPRLHTIEKEDIKHQELNNKLIKDLREGAEKSAVIININRIQLIGSSINILESEHYLGIYIVNKKKETEEEIELNDSEIIDYIEKYSDLITSIDQIRFVLYNADGDPIEKGLSFLKLVYCEMESDERFYILDNGKWGYFNDKFYELLKAELNEIDDIVEFRSDLSIEYDSYEKGELAGEGGYIETLSQDPDLIKLHKRNVSTSETTIEIADIYDKRRKELLAIKRGTKTSVSMYSFEQSLTSLQVLRNREDFNVKEELLKYNVSGKYRDEKKYPYVDEELVDDIVNCRNSSVVWLIDESPQYIFEKVNNESLKLNDFKSLMLKLKIVDWYNFMKDNSYNPKLYFAVDKPRKIKGSSDRSKELDAVIS